MRPRSTLRACLAAMLACFGSLLAAPAAFSQISEPADSVEEARALLVQAQRLIDGGAADVARDSILELLAVEAFSDSQALRADAYGTLGLAQLQLGAFDEAEAAFERSVYAAAAASEPAVEARGRFNLAHVRGRVIPARASSLAVVLASGERDAGGLGVQGGTDTVVAAGTLATEYARAATLASVGDDHALAAEAWIFSAKAERFGEQDADALIALDKASQELGFLAPAARARTVVAFAEELAQVAANSNVEAADLEAGLGLVSTAAVDFAARNDREGEAYARGVAGQLLALLGRRAEAMSETRQAMLLADAVDAPEQLFVWQAQLGLLQAAAGESASELAAYRQAIASINLGRDRMAASNLFAGRAFFNDVVQPFILSYVDALVRPADGGAPSQDALREALEAADLLRTIELEQYLGEVCVGSGKSVRLNAVDSNAALVFPVLRARRIDVIVATSDGLSFVSTEANGRDIADMASLLRATLSRPELADADAYREPAQLLYDALIRPIEPEIDGADTLIFSIDGPLRLVPMAALWDGERHLVERYAVGNAASLTITDLRPFEQALKRPLYLGVSEPGPGYEALPSVRNELEALRAALPGPVLLNRAFTKSEVSSITSETPVSVLHIATHGFFNEAAASSFVLAGDGPLTFDELGELISGAGAGRVVLELVVLSACQTAVGDDRAALGLAGMAYRSGAKAVIGSLWSVSDASTERLQAAFYTELADGSGKAKALRAAQMALIASEEFSHPYFWSPFVLAGNWL